MSKLQIVRLFINNLFIEKMKKQFFVMAFLCLSATVFTSCSNDDEIEEVKHQNSYQTMSTPSTGTGLGGTNPENGDDDGDDKDTGGIKVPGPKK